MGCGISGGQQIGSQCKRAPNRPAPSFCHSCVFSGSQRRAFSFLVAGVTWNDKKSRCIDRQPTTTSGSQWRCRTWSSLEAPGLATASDRSVISPSQSRMNQQPSPSSRPQCCNFSTTKSFESGVVVARSELAAAAASHVCSDDLYATKTPPGVGTRLVVVRMASVLVVL